MNVALRAVGAVLVCSLAIAACGDDDDSQRDAGRGGCSVAADADGGAVIRCDDGTSVTIAPGRDGSDGKDGINGTSCHIEGTSDAGVTIRCDDGSSVVFPAGAQGPEGPRGPMGDPGPVGPFMHVTGAGLTLELLAASVDTDGHPIVQLHITDGSGAALDRNGELTQGTVAPRFTLAVAGDEGYTPLITSTVTSALTDQSAEQPTSDSGGEWTTLDLAGGLYQYRFGATLPDDDDASKTHRIGCWGTRSVDGVTYAADTVLDFRPDGDTPGPARELVTTEACNGCHDPLAVHGEQRLSVGLCETCHTPGAVDPDTGNSLDFKVMIHKIHAGPSLPSVASTPYQIIGFGDRTHDYSDVRFPQELNHCSACHQGADGDHWQTDPSVEACGSCHDNIDFTLAVPDPNPSDSIDPHPGGPKQNGSCTQCHAPAPDGLPGLAIADLHARGALDQSTPELTLEILDVTGTAPGDVPTLTFRVAVDGAGRNLRDAPLDRLTLVLSGPSDDVAGFRSYDVQTDDPLSSSDALTDVDAADGKFAYTLPESWNDAAAAFVQPVAAEGSFALMLEGVQSFDVQTPGGGSESVRVGAHNPVRYVALSGGDAQPRRDVVALDKCNSCHRALSMHGGAANDVSACALCHGARLDTFDVAPAPATGEVTTASLRFGPLIHHIHGSAITTQALPLYNFRGDPVDLDDVRYPGAVEDCARCHEDSSFDLPLPAGLLPSVTRIKDASDMLAGQSDPLPATAAACQGCHDSAASLAHAETMTTAMGQESCAVCHASGRSAGVDSVHARPAWDY